MYDFFVVCFCFFCFLFFPISMNFGTLARAIDMLSISTLNRRESRVARLSTVESLATRDYVKK